jgi:hypothetical protein
MSKIIDGRRAFSDKKFEELKGLLIDAPGICGGKACVYATGSFGRREASEHSDIDLFIVSLSDKDEQRKIERSRLSKLEEILLKADLIRASQKMSFPPFSQDGRFLQNHGLRSLIKATGNERDDAENTFTARLLLLLESRSLAGEEVHSEAINDVIGEYWADFPPNFDRFMPAYLSNDILRYWRTLCLNYEANQSDSKQDSTAARRLNNYKLKHSRMLTCYSALIFLLYIHAKRGTVEAADAQMMVRLTPTQRVEWVADDSKDTRLVDTIGNLLGCYERFLSVTNESKAVLKELFADDKRAEIYRAERSEFGDLMYKVLSLIGDGDKFYRRLVV